MTWRWLAGVEALSPRRTAALLVGLAVLSAAGQMAFYRLYEPPPSHATRYGVSGVLGLLHGHGLTVADEEAVAVFDAGPDDDLLVLYDPDAPRGPSHEPMPGVTLLFLAVAAGAGALRLSTIVLLQALAHAGLSAWIFLELRHRSGLAALLAAAGWAFFLPQYRVMASPGHDAFTSLAYLVSVLLMLRFHRTGGLGSLLAVGAVCGAGLWLRSYFLTLPAVYVVLLAVWKPPRLRSVAVFAAPVVLAGMGLAVVRGAESGTQHAMVRGAVWHNFFTGVGQFENPLQLNGTDWSVRELAERHSGRDYAYPNYQYDPGYNRVLAEIAGEYIPEHRPELLRNAVYRVAWLLFPSFAPSAVFAANPAVRIALVAAGIPLSLLAIYGFAVTVRRDAFLALVVLAPWLSLVPVTLYYIAAKTATHVFFGPVMLAAFAVAELAAGRLPAFRPRPSPGAPAAAVRDARGS